MEIKDMMPTAVWDRQIKAEDRDGNPLPPQTLKLTLQFIGIDQGIDFIPRGKDAPAITASEANRALIAASITEWDLTKNGEPVEVNGENKKLYVPQIANAETVEGDVVGYELVAFIRNQNNFLKNS